MNKNTANPNSRRCRKRHGTVKKKNPNRTLTQSHKLWCFCTQTTVAQMKIKVAIISICRKTSIAWAVRLSWLENVLLQHFGGGQFWPVD